MEEGGGGRARGSPPTDVSARGCARCVVQAVPPRSPPTDVWQAQGAQDCIRYCVEQHVSCAQHGNQRGNLGVVEQARLRAADRSAHGGLGPRPTARAMPDRGTLKEASTPHPPPPLLGAPHTWPSTPPIAPSPTIRVSLAALGVGDVDSTDDELVALGEAVQVESVAHSVRERRRLGGDRGRHG